MEKSQNIRTKSAFIPKNNLKHNFFFLYTLNLLMKLKEVTMYTSKLTFAHCSPKAWASHIRLRKPWYTFVL